MRGTNLIPIWLATVLAAALPTAAHAQDGTISGTVTDASSLQPLRSAQVYAGGATAGYDFRYGTSSQIFGAAWITDESSLVYASYQEDSYTALEGGEAATVTVKLSSGWYEELAIPIRVTRPESTEVDDYTVDGLEEWDAQEGTGKLTFVPFRRLRR